MGARRAKRRLFSMTGSPSPSPSPRVQGEVCTLQPLLVHQGFFFEWIMHTSVGGWFSGVFPG